MKKHEYFSPHYEALANILWDLHHNNPDPLKIIRKLQMEGHHYVDLMSLMDLVDILDKNFKDRCIK